MLLDHWFWLLLTVAVMVWYSTITVHVTIRGIADIRDMLTNLKAMDDQRPGAVPEKNA